MEPLANPSRMSLPKINSMGRIANMAEQGEEERKVIGVTQSLKHIDTSNMVIDNRHSNYRGSLLEPQKPSGMILD